MTPADHPNFPINWDALHTPIRTLPFEGDDHGFFHLDSFVFSLPALLTSVLPFANIANYGRSAQLMAREPLYSVSLEG